MSKHSSYDLQTELSFLRAQQSQRYLVLPELFPYYPIWYVILLWAFADFQELLSDPWMNSQHRIIEKYERAVATAAFVIKLKGAS